MKVLVLSLVFTSKIVRNDVSKIIKVGFLVCYISEYLSQNFEEELFIFLSFTKISICNFYKFIHFKPINIY